VATRRRGRRGRRLGLGGVLVFFLAAAAATAAAWWLARGGASDPAPPAAAASTAAEPRPLPGVRPANDAGEPAPATPTEPEPGSAADVPRDAPPPVAAPPDGAYVALVIDDLGRSVADVARLAGLDVPVSYAVLPFETRTAQVVAELRRRGAEVLLHLPMEGRNGADPGPGALTVGMGEAALAAATREALAAVPGAVGVNNHMGSVLSADASAMRVVLRELAGRGVFFLDSRTTADSVAYPAARALGMAAAERDVFLDPDLDPEAIRAQFHRLLDLARREGSAVAIGHPHPATLQVLAEEVPRARGLGYTFVPVSHLLDRDALPE
jgi:uncharacterized protein